MKLQGQVHAKDCICGWMHATVYTKNCHSLIVFDTYGTFDTCHNATVKKDYKRLDLMIVYLWNFAHVKNNPWKKIFMTKILNFFSSYEVHIKCF